MLLMVAPMLLTKHYMGRKFSTNMVLKIELCFGTQRVLIFFYSV